MIERKKRIMMMAKSNVLDTSPVILEHGKRYERGNVIQVASDRCITDFYDFVSTTSDDRYIYSYGIAFSILVFSNGEYKDYWNYESPDGEKLTIGLNVGCNQVKFTLIESLLDDCYVYQVTTGKIFFAGKNSIYYGHRNISEVQ